MEAKFIKKDGVFAEYELDESTKDAVGVNKKYSYKEEKIPERKEKKDEEK